VKEILIKEKLEDFTVRGYQNPEYGIWDIHITLLQDVRQETRSYSLEESPRWHLTFQLQIWSIFFYH